MNAVLIALTTLLILGIVVAVLFARAWWGQHCRAERLAAELDDRAQRQRIDEVDQNCIRRTRELEERFERTRSQA